MGATFTRSVARSCARSRRLAGRLPHRPTEPLPLPRESRDRGSQATFAARPLVDQAVEVALGLTSRATARRITREKPLEQAPGGCAQLAVDRDPSFAQGGQRSVKE